MFIKPKWLKKGFCVEEKTSKDIFRLIAKDQPICDLKRNLNITQNCIILHNIFVGDRVINDWDRLVSYYTENVKIVACINSYLITIKIKNGVVTKTPYYLNLDLE